MKIRDNTDNSHIIKHNTIVDAVSANIAAKKKTAGSNVPGGVVETESLWSGSTDVKSQQGDVPGDLWEPVDWDSIDTVVVSEEAKRGPIDWQSKLDEMRNEMRALLENLERAREAGEGAAEAWKEKIRCMQIAMRIMSGNKVPEADHRYLREKDAELYGKAITMRMEKVDPKEHDRLSEDEEEEGGIIENTENVSAASSDSGSDAASSDGFTVSAESD